VAGPIAGATSTGAGTREAIAVTGIT